MSNTVKFITEQGDILNRSYYDFVCHQVNCIGKMGAGLAKQIADMYPEVKDGYIAHSSIHKPDELLGTCFLSETFEGLNDWRGPKYIANLYGQLNIGTNKQQTDYKALQKAIQDFYKQLSEIIPQKNGYNLSEPLRIAFPKNMGCGLAGGSWDIVEKIIIKESSFAAYYYNMDLDIYIVEYSN